MNRSRECFRPRVSSSRHSLYRMERKSINATFKRRKNHFQTYTWKSFRSSWKRRASEVDLNVWEDAAVKTLGGELYSGTKWGEKGTRECEFYSAIGFLQETTLEDKIGTDDDDCLGNTIRIYYAITNMIEITRLMKQTKRTRYNISKRRT